MAILYIDLKAAYASVIRKWVGPTSVAADIWKERLGNMGLDDLDIEAIFEEAIQFKSWREAGGSEHLLHLVAESHESTWASIEGITRVMKYLGGVIAGTPQADLMFILAFSRCVWKLDAAVEESNLDEQIDMEGFLGSDPPQWLVDECEKEGLLSGDCGTVSVSFVDDLTMALFGPACDIVASTEKFANLLIRTFMLHGFTVNLKPSKSAAKRYFNGVGTVEAEQRIFHENGSKLKVLMPNGEEEVIHCVNGYKHLGTRNSVRGGMSGEVGTRLASMSESFIPLKPVLARENLSRTRKSAIANIYIYIYI